MAYINHPIQNWAHAVSRSCLKYPFGGLVELKVRIEPTSKAEKLFWLLSVNYFLSAIILPPHKFIPFLREKKCFLQSRFVSMRILPRLSSYYWLDSVLSYSDKPGPLLMELVRAVQTNWWPANWLQPTWEQSHCTRLPFVSLIMAHMENDNICSAPCDHSSQLLATGLGTLAAPVTAQATPFCYTGWGTLLFRMILWCTGKLLLCESQEDCYTHYSLNLITFHFIYWTFIKNLLCAQYVC